MTRTPTIIEGRLADIDGVRHGQLLIEGGVIRAVGTNLGRADHVFGDDCLIFAGMGDVHIHAREDVTGRETHKETFAAASAAALHGGVLHVADMPNNPAAPVDDASYDAKERLLLGQRLPVTFTLYAGIGPEPGRCGATCRTRLTWGRALANCSSHRWSSSTRRWPITRCKMSASTARTRSCWRSTGGPPRTRRAARPSAS